MVLLLYQVFFFIVVFLRAARGPVRVCMTKQNQFGNIFFPEKTFLSSVLLLFLPIVLVPRAVDAPLGS